MIILLNLELGIVKERQKEAPVWLSQIISV